MMYKLSLKTEPVYLSGSPFINKSKLGKKWKKLGQMY